VPNQHFIPVLCYPDVLAFKVRDFPLYVTVSPFWLRLKLLFIILTPKAAKEGDREWEVDLRLTIC
jgi:hypothetical protein